MIEINLLFAKNVKKYRLKNNFSQEELAARTGLHRTYISDIERCKRSISLNNVAKIAAALKVDYYILFKEDLEE